MFQDNGFGKDSLKEIVFKMLKAEEDIIMGAMRHFGISLDDAYSRIYVLDERTRKTYYMDGVPAIVIERNLDLENNKGTVSYTELYK